MSKPHTATASPARPLLTRLSKFFRKPLVIFATVLLLGLAAWLTVRQVQINQDRARFMQAKADVHSLAEQIVASVGQPTERQTVQSCGYTSVVYGRGARFCDVDENIAYTLEQSQVEAYIQKVESAVRSSGLVRNYKVEDHLNATPPEQDVSVTFSLPNPLPCGLQILRVDPTIRSQRHSYIGFIGLTNVGISMEIYCGGGAKAEYFSVK